MLSPCPQEQMPSQLLSRLRPVLDEDIRSSVTALRNERRNDVLGPVPTHPSHPNEPASNTHPHWPAGHFGEEISPAQSVVIHGTGGWPSHASADNFRGHYDCTNYLDYSERRGWFETRGIGPQYFVDPNGTAFSLIGPESFVGNPLLTWHAEEMNGLSVGIENSDVADSGATPTSTGNAKYWSALSTAAEDLTGRKAYLLLHPASDPDAAVFWSAIFPHYVGAGDLNTASSAVNSEYGGWKNMLFTERNYRSLALLCRVVTASLGIPKNFPLFPYLTRAHDCRNEVLFRQMILADPACDAIATKLGTTTATIRANAAAYRTWYHTGPDYTKTYPDGSTQPRNNKWTLFFGVDRDGVTKSSPCFKGLISHAINGDHPCPGPLFDWYRLAREVWDYWWYPFDMLAGTSGTITAPRGYRAARRTTPVIDYYFDAGETSLDFDQVREAPDAANPFPLPRDRFTIPNTTPVYALANGVIVAARIPVATGPANPGFLLTRHEIYTRPLVGTGEMPLDYNHPPTIVWSLITYLSPAGAQLDQITAANPEWLNRVIIRAKECQLVADFWEANKSVETKPFLRPGLGYMPLHRSPPLTTGEQIDLDGDAYSTLLNGLASGTPRLFPLESGDATPVRTILGDFVGTPGDMKTGTSGIQIEIFSKEQLPVTGAAQRVNSIAGETWYKAACTSLRHEGSVSKDLPADGNAWHYPVMSFLDWLNPITWKSEWAKHGIKAADGSTAPAPERRNMRIVTL
jgi:hypothetical protein